jgi:hypothetical protein
MLRVVRILALCVCVSVVVLSAMPSHTIAAEVNPVTLHLKLRKVANRLGGVPLGSGRYVSYSTYDASTGSLRFVLLDDETGKRVAVHACGGPASPTEGMLGVPWLAFDCAPDAQRFQLYNIYTHRWRRLACDSTCQRDYYLVSIIGVGANWLALEVAPHQSCGDGVHSECGPSTTLFYDIATGKRRSPEPTGNSVIDLDSPMLTRRVCAPVSVPPGFPTFPPLVKLDRGFALVQSGNGIYAERCGSPERTYLVTGGYAGGLVESQHAVGFCQTQPQPNAPQEQISGAYLPSLTRFTTILPAGSSCVVALGPRHLYIAGPPNATALWAAPFPSRVP